MRSRALALVLLAALAAPISLAHADGDPASDFLLSQSTFLSPYDGHIPAAQAKVLVAMLASAQKQGFPLKVAVIVTRYDLGAVPILFGKAQTYAKFLAEEDYYYWKDELLVVMPNGYGLYKTKNLPAADVKAIAALPQPKTNEGATLVSAAQTAVSALARLRGITLSTSAGTSGGSSMLAEDLEIAGGAAVLVILGFGARYWRRRRA